MASPLHINLDNKLDLDFSEGNKFKVKEFDFVFANPERKSSLTFTLLKHFVFCLNDQHNVVFEEDIALKSSARKFKAANVVDLVPVNFPFKFSKGKFEYDLLLLIPKELDSLKLKGRVALLFSDLRLYSRYLRDLSIISEVNAVIFDTKTVKLADSRTELFVNGVQCLGAKTNGALAFNKTDDSKLVILVDNINKYFLDLLYDGMSTNVKDLNAEGEIYCKFTKDERYFVDGEIHMPEAVFGNVDGKPGEQKPTKVNGRLNFNIAGTEKELDIENIGISLRKQEKEIVHLDVSGNIPSQTGTNRAKLSVVSDHLELEELLPIYRMLNKSINENFAKKGNEYEPIDFGELNLDGDVRFNRVSYGKLLDSSFHSRLRIKDNKITIREEKSQFSGTDIRYYGALETNHKDGYPFKFRTNFNDLDLKPFMETFVTGDYKGADGAVDSFSLSLQGKGFLRKI